ncbi:MAG: LCP family protein [Oscillospiraceae bacterium]
MRPFIKGVLCLAPILLAAVVTNVVLRLPQIGAKADHLSEPSCPEQQEQRARRAAEAPVDTAEIPAAQDPYRILVCGIDNTKMLADVVLYVRIDPIIQKAAVLQIPRDFFVGSEYETGKLNAACLPFDSKDPCIRLRRVLKAQFALETDGSLAVTLAGVRALVDAMGGIEVQLPREVDYLPGKTLPAGQQRLSGEQAEWLLRYRKGYELADLGRLEMQKLFLLGAFEAARGVGRLEAVTIAARCYGHIKTDIPLSTASALISAGLSLTEADLTVRTVPTYGATYKGYSVLCADRFRLAAAINETVRINDPVSPWDLYLQFPPEPSTSEALTQDDSTQKLFDFSWPFSQVASDEAIAIP